MRGHALTLTTFSPFKYGAKKPSNMAPKEVNFLKLYNSSIWFIKFTNSAQNYTFYCFHTQNMSLFYIKDTLYNIPIF